MFQETYLTLKSTIGKFKVSDAYSRFIYATWSIQVKSTTSSCFHIGEEGNQAGHQVLSFPEVLISLPSFKQSRVWQGSLLGTAANITGRIQALLCFGRKTCPGGGLRPRWQSGFLWMCVQQKYSSKECICRTWILAAWVPDYLWIK